MINLLKKGIQKLNGKLSQYEQLRINDENENQAMSCGALNPRFLAKIKRSKTDNNTNKSKEKLTATFKNG
ncbi:MAG: hypothetical protein ACNYZG_05995 [Gammaproteobacteria bacterium]